jgi:hypothetical protein
VPTACALLGTSAPLAAARLPLGARAAGVKEAPKHFVRVKVGMELEQRQLGGTHGQTLSIRFRNRIICNYGGSH